MAKFGSAHADILQWTSLGNVQMPVRDVVNNSTGNYIGELSVATDNIPRLTTFNHYTDNFKDQGEAGTKQDAVEGITGLNTQADKLGFASTNVYNRGLVGDQDGVLSVDAAGQGKWEQSKTFNANFKENNETGTQQDLKDAVADLGHTAGLLDFKPNNVFNRGVIGNLDGLLSLNEKADYNNFIITKHYTANFNAQGKEGITEDSNEAVEGLAKDAQTLGVMGNTAFNRGMIGNIEGVLSLNAFYQYDRFDTAKNFTENFKGQGESGIKLDRIDAVDSQANDAALLGFAPNTVFNRGLIGNIDGVLSLDRAGQYQSFSMFKDYQANFKDQGDAGIKLDAKEAVSSTAHAAELLDAAPETVFNRGMIGNINGMLSLDKNGAAANFTTFNNYTDNFKSEGISGSSKDMNEAVEGLAHNADLLGFDAKIVSNRGVIGKVDGLLSLNDKSEYGSFNPINNGLTLTNVPLTHESMQDMAEGENAPITITHVPNEDGTGKSHPIYTANSDVKLPGTAYTLTKGSSMELNDIAQHINLEIRQNTSNPHVATVNILDQAIHLGVDADTHLKINMDGGPKTPLTSAQDFGNFTALIGKSTNGQSQLLVNFDDTKTGVSGNDLKGQDTTMAVNISGSFRTFAGTYTNDAGEKTTYDGNIEFTDKNGAAVTLLGSFNNMLSAGSDGKLLILQGTLDVSNNSRLYLQNGNITGQDSGRGAGGSRGTPQQRLIDLDHDEEGVYLSNGQIDVNNGELFLALTQKLNLRSSDSTFTINYSEVKGLESASENQKFVYTDVRGKDSNELISLETYNRVMANNFLMAGKNGDISLAKLLGFVDEARDLAKGNAVPYSLKVLDELDTKDENGFTVRDKIGDMIQRAKDGEISYGELLDEAKNLNLSYHTIAAMEAAGMKGSKTFTASQFNPFTQPDRDLSDILQSYTRISAAGAVKFDSFGSKEYMVGQLNDLIKRQTEDDMPAWRDNYTQRDILSSTIEDLGALRDAFENGDSAELQKLYEKIDQAKDPLTGGSPDATRNMRAGLADIFSLNAAGSNLLELKQALLTNALTSQDVAAADMIGKEIAFLPRIEDQLKAYGIDTEGRLNKLALERAMQKLTGDENFKIENKQDLEKAFYSGNNSIQDKLNADFKFYQNQYPHVDENGIEHKGDIYAGWKAFQSENPINYFLASTFNNPLYFWNGYGRAEARALGITGIINFESVTNMAAVALSAVVIGEFMLAASAGARAALTGVGNRVLSVFGENLGASVTNQLVNGGISGALAEFTTKESLKALAVNSVAGGGIYSVLKTSVYMANTESITLDGAAKAAFSGFLEGAEFAAEFTAGGIALKGLRAVSVEKNLLDGYTNVVGSMENWSYLGATARTAGITASVAGLRVGYDWLAGNNITAQDWFESVGRGIGTGLLMSLALSPTGAKFLGAAGDKWTQMATSGLTAGGINGWLSLAEAQNVIQVATLQAAIWPAVHLGMTFGGSVLDSLFSGTSMKIAVTDIYGAPTGAKVDFWSPAGAEALVRGLVAAPLQGFTTGPTVAVWGAGQQAILSDITFSFANILPKSVTSLFVNRELAGGSFYSQFIKTPLALAAQSENKLFSAIAGYLAHVESAVWMGMQVGLIHKGLEMIGYKGAELEQMSWIALFTLSKIGFSPIEKLLISEMGSLGVKAGDIAEALSTYKSAGGGVKGLIALEGTPGGEFLDRLIGSRAQALANKWDREMTPEKDRWYDRKADPDRGENPADHEVAVKAHNEHQLKAAEAELRNEFEDKGTIGGRSVEDAAIHTAAEQRVADWDKALRDSTEANDQQDWAWHNSSPERWQAHYDHQYQEALKQVRAEYAEPTSSLRDQVFKLDTSVFLQVAVMAILQQHLIDPKAIAELTAANPLLLLKALTMAATTRDRLASLDKPNAEPLSPKEMAIVASGLRSGAIKAVLEVDKNVTAPQISFGAIDKLLLSRAGVRTLDIKEDGTAVQQFKDAAKKDPKLAKDPIAETLVKVLTSPQTIKARSLNPEQEKSTRGFLGNVLENLRIRAADPKDAARREYIDKRKEFLLERQAKMTEHDVLLMESVLAGVQTMIRDMNGKQILAQKVQEILDAAQNFFDRQQMNVNGVPVQVNGDTKIDDLIKAQGITLDTIKRNLQSTIDTLKQDIAKPNGPYNNENGKAEIFKVIQTAVRQAIYHELLLHAQKIFQKPGEKITVKSALKDGQLVFSEIASYHVILSSSFGRGLMKALELSMGGGKEFGLQAALVTATFFGETWNGRAPKLLLALGDDNQVLVNQAVKEGTLLNQAAKSGLIKLFDAWVNADTHSTVVREIHGTGENIFMNSDLSRPGVYVIKGEDLKQIGLEMTTANGANVRAKSVELLLNFDSVAFDEFHAFAGSNDLIIGSSAKDISSIRANPELNALMVKELGPVYEEMRILADAVNKLLSGKTEEEKNAMLDNFRLGQFSLVSTLSEQLWKEFSDRGGIFKSLGKEEFDRHLELAVTVQRKLIHSRFYSAEDGTVTVNSDTGTPRERVVLGDIIESSFAQIESFRNLRSDPVRYNQRDEFEAVAGALLHSTQYKITALDVMDILGSEIILPASGTLGAREGMLSLFNIDRTSIQAYAQKPLDAKILTPGREARGNEILRIADLSYKPMAAQTDVSTRQTTRDLPLHEVVQLFKDLEARLNKGEIDLQTYKDLRDDLTTGAISLGVSETSIKDLQYFAAVVLAHFAPNSIAARDMTIIVKYQTASGSSENGTTIYHLKAGEKIRTESIKSDDADNYHRDLFQKIADKNTPKLSTDEQAETTDTPADTTNDVAADHKVLYLAQGLIEGSNTFGVTNGKANFIKTFFSDKDTTDQAIARIKAGSRDAFLRAPGVAYELIDTVDRDSMTAEQAQRIELADTKGPADLRDTVVMIQKELLSNSSTSRALSVIDQRAENESWSPERKLEAINSLLNTFPGIQFAPSIAYGPVQTMNDVNTGLFPGATPAEILAVQDHLRGLNPLQTDNLNYTQKVFIANLQTVFGAIENSDGTVLESLSAFFDDESGNLASGARLSAALNFLTLPALAGGLVQPENPVSGNAQQLLELSSLYSQFNALADPNAPSQSFHEAISKVIKADVYQSVMTEGKKDKDADETKLKAKAESESKRAVASITNTNSAVRALRTSANPQRILTAYLFTLLSDNARFNNEQVKPIAGALNQRLVLLIERDEFMGRIRQAQDDQRKGRVTVDETRTNVIAINKDLKKTRQKMFDNDRALETALAQTISLANASGIVRVMDRLFSMANERASEYHERTKILSHRADDIVKAWDTTDTATKDRLVEDVKEQTARLAEEMDSFTLSGASGFYQMANTLQEHRKLLDSMISVATEKADNATRDRAIIARKELVQITALLIQKMEPLSMANAGHKTPAPLVYDKQSFRYAAGAVHQLEESLIKTPSMTDDEVGNKAMINEAKVGLVSTAKGLMAFAAENLDLISGHQNVQVQTVIAEIGSILKTLESNEAPFADDVSIGNLASNLADRLSEYNTLWFHESEKGALDRSIRLVIYLASRDDQKPQEKSVKIAKLLMGHQDLLMAVVKNSMQDIDKLMNDREWTHDAVQAKLEQAQALRGLIDSFSAPGSTEAVAAAVHKALFPSDVLGVPAGLATTPLLLLTHDLVRKSTMTDLKGKPTSLRTIFEDNHVNLEAFNNYKYFITVTKGKTDAASILETLNTVKAKVQELKEKGKHTEAHRAYHRELYPVYSVAIAFGYLKDADPIHDDITKIKSELSLDEKDMQALDQKLKEVFKPVIPEAEGKERRKKQALSQAMSLLDSLNLMSDQQIENDKARIRGQVIRQAVDIDSAISDLETSLIKSATFLQKSYKTRAELDQRTQEILAENPVLSVGMDEAVERLKKDFDAAQQAGTNRNMMLSPNFQSPKDRLIFVKESVLKAEYGEARAAYMPGTDLIIVPVDDETGEISQEIAENVYHEGRHINSIDFWTADLREAITEGRTVQSAPTKDASKKVWDVSGYKPDMRKSAQIFYDAEVGLSGELLGPDGKALVKETVDDKNKALDIAQFTGDLLHAVRAIAKPQSPLTGNFADDITSWSQGALTMLLVNPFNAMATNAGFKLGSSLGMDTTKLDERRFQKIYDYYRQWTKQQPGLTFAGFLNEAFIKRGGLDKKGADPEKLKEAQAQIQIQINIYDKHKAEIENLPTAKAALIDSISRSGGISGMTDQEKVIINGFIEALPDDLRIKVVDNLEEWKYMFEEEKHEELAPRGWFELDAFGHPVIYSTSFHTTPWGMAHELLHILQLTQSQNNLDLYSQMTNSLSERKDETSKRLLGRLQEWRANLLGVQGIYNEQQIPREFGAYLYQEFMYAGTNAETREIQEKDQKDIHLYYQKVDKKYPTAKAITPAMREFVKDVLSLPKSDPVRDEVLGLAKTYFAWIHPDLPMPNEALQAAVTASEKPLHIKMGILNNLDEKKAYQRTLEMYRKVIAGKEINAKSIMSYEEFLLIIVIGSEHVRFDNQTRNHFTSWYATDENREADEAQVAQNKAKFSEREDLINLIESLPANLFMTHGTTASERPSNGRAVEEEKKAARQSTETDKNPKGARLVEQAVPREKLIAALKNNHETKLLPQEAAEGLLNLLEGGWLSVDQVNSIRNVFYAIEPEVRGSYQALPLNWDVMNQFITSSRLQISRQDYENFVTAMPVLRNSAGARAAAQAAPLPRAERIPFSTMGARLRSAVAPSRFEPINMADYIDAALAGEGAEDQAIKVAGARLRARFENKPAMDNDSFETIQALALKTLKDNKMETGRAQMLASRIAAHAYRYLFVAGIRRLIEGGYTQNAAYLLDWDMVKEIAQDKEGPAVLKALLPARGNTHAFTVAAFGDTDRTKEVMSTLKEWGIEDVMVLSFDSQSAFEKWQKEKGISRYVLTASSNTDAAVKIIQEVLKNASANQSVIVDANSRFGYKAMAAPFAISREDRVVAIGKFLIQFQSTALKNLFDNPKFKNLIRFINPWEALQALSNALHWTQVSA